MTKNASMQTRGFSMVETVIVVAILAILAGLATPAFVQFLDTKTAQQEANTMKEIGKALEVFATTYGRLPHDDGNSPSSNNSFCNNAPNGWEECLAMVSNLTPNEIRTDAWGNPRVYTMLRDTSASAAYIGATIQRHYAMVMSRGVDQNAEAQTGVPTTAESGTPFTTYAAATNGGWWHRYGTTVQRVARYTNMEKLEDDFLVRYSDADLKRQQYEITLNRINKIYEALESYSAARYNLALANASESGDPNKKYYYPRSVYSSGGGITSDTYQNYGDQVWADMTASMFSLNGLSDRLIENRVGTAYEERRLGEMKNLMRLLGLPDSYCCNAMERMSSNPEQEAPFYYYSNPRGQKSDGSCYLSRAGRLNPAPLYLPPKVQVENYPCP